MAVADHRSGREHDLRVKGETLIVLRLHLRQVDVQKGFVFRDGQRPRVIKNPLHRRQGSDCLGPYETTQSNLDRTLTVAVPGEA